MQRVSWNIWKNIFLYLEITQIIARWCIMWCFFPKKICFCYSCLIRSHGQNVSEQLRFSPLMVRSSTALSLHCLSHKSSMIYYICTRERFAIFMWLKCSHLLSKLQLKCLLLPLTLLSACGQKLGNTLMHCGALFCVLDDETLISHSDNSLLLIQIRFWCLLIVMLLSDSFFYDSLKIDIQMRCSAR